MNGREEPRLSKVVIVGGGFTGLSAAYELARSGVAATVLEQDDVVGGLAGSFDVDGVALEKFYHHWFTNDRHVTDLVKELGAEDDVVFRESRTGMYYANSIYRLSRPLDVLRFTPLGVIDRLRLGLLVLQARRVKDWQALESETAEQWITRLAGEHVYRIVWEPLLRAKFGDCAREISAVWFWNKLKLRGGSRGKRGAEVLAYYRGGFAALAAKVVQAIQAAGGTVRTSCAVRSLIVDDGRVVGLQTAHGRIDADVVLLTVPLPIAADLMQPHGGHEYAARLRRIRYLGNICLVLQLDRSLSDTYWLNVNDPTFPYVGIIEHTNFEPPSSYHGRHVVYMSKYLSHDDEAWSWADDQICDRSIPHIQRMFPAFRPEWIRRHHVWRTKYAQPIVVRHYSRIAPGWETPIGGVYLATMAQVYPEDRGTNYAIRDGRRVARHLVANVVHSRTPGDRPVAAAV